MNLRNKKGQSSQEINGEFITMARVIDEGLSTRELKCSLEKSMWICYENTWMLVDPSHLPALTAQPSLGDQTTSRHSLLDKTQEEDHVVLPVTVHGDIAAMLTHTQTLAQRESTIPDLLQALDELEYHVHEIDNARDLNAVGGLVVIVRLLNHSSPDVRGSAATVIGSASQR